VDRPKSGDRIGPRWEREAKHSQAAAQWVSRHCSAKSRCSLTHSRKHSAGMPRTVTRRFDKRQTRLTSRPGSRSGLVGAVSFGGRRRRIKMRVGAGRGPWATD
jgi:hypothetical protein